MIPCEHRDDEAKCTEATTPVVDGRRSRCSAERRRLRERGGFPSLSCTDQMPRGRTTSLPVQQSPFVNPRHLSHRRVWSARPRLSGLSQKLFEFHASGSSRTSAANLRDAEKCSASIIVYKPQITQDSAVMRERTSLAACLVRSTCIYSVVGHQVKRQKKFTRIS